MVMARSKYPNQNEYSGSEIRKQTEEALRASEEKIRLLLNSAAEAIYGLDMEGNCTFCNNTCLRLLGYNLPEDLLGKNMHWQIHSKHEDGTPFTVEECRIFKAFKIGEGTHVDDEVLWRSDGTSFPAEYWSYPQIHDGIVTGAVVSFFDITERRRAEEELKQVSARLALAEREKLEDSEGRYHSLFQGSSDGIMIFNVENRMILFANSAQCQMLGYTEEQLKKMNLAEIHPKEKFRDTLIVFEKQARGEINFAENIQCIKQNGEVIHVDITTSHIVINGNKHLVGFFRDITKEIEAREKLMISEKLAVMGRLVADVAHELNNPLAIIIGRAQIMLHRIEGEQLQLTGPLETILQNARRCSTILSGLLNYSRTIGKKESTVFLPDLLQEAVESVNWQYDMSGIEVVLNCNMPGNIKVTGNRVALLSVLVNLIRNARQAMHEKGRLTITLEKEGENQLCIEIIDNGIVAPDD